MTKAGLASKGLLPTKVRLATKRRLAEIWLIIIGKLSIWAGECDQRTRVARFWKWWEIASEILRPVVFGTWAEGRWEELVTISPLQLCHRCHTWERSHHLVATVW